MKETDEPKLDKRIQGRLSCPEFLDLYSDYRDGLVDGPTRAAVMAHMRDCASCSRYDRVLRSGVAVLLNSPLPETEGGGLEPVTLQRRAREVKPAHDPALSPVGSGFMAAAAVLVAVLFGAVAWSPVLFGNGTPEVEMAPVVASAPSVRPGLLRMPLSLQYMTATDELDALARSLLFEYSRPRAGLRAVMAGPEPE